MKKTVGKAESKILNYVLKRKSTTVGDAAKYFFEKEGLARTTVLTVMERLRKKGLLVRKSKNGVFNYEPKVQKKKWLKQQIGEFVNSTLGGGLAPLVEYLADSKELSKSEVKELQKLIERLN